MFTGAPHTRMTMASHGRQIVSHPLLGSVSSSTVSRPEPVFVSSIQQRGTGLNVLGLTPTPTRMEYPDSDRAIGSRQVPECVLQRSHAIDREGNTLYHIAITNLVRRLNQMS